MQLLKHSFLSAFTASTIQEEKNTKAGIAILFILYEICNVDGRLKFLILVSGKYFVTLDIGHILILFSLCSG